MRAASPPQYILKRDPLVGTNTLLRLKGRALAFIFMGSLSFSFVANFVFKFKSGSFGKLDNYDLMEINAALQGKASSARLI